MVTFYTSAFLQLDKKIAWEEIVFFQDFFHLFPYCRSNESDDKDGNYPEDLWAGKTWGHSYRGKKKRHGRGQKLMSPRTTAKKKSQNICPLDKTFVKLQKLLFLSFLASDCAKIVTNHFINFLILQRSAKCLSKLSLALLCFLP